MPRKLTLKQIQKVINVNDFNDITKEGIQKLLPIIGNIDKELAIKIIEQFPNFREFANEMIQHINNGYYSVLETNKESAYKVMDAYQAIINTLNDLAKAESTLPDDQKYFINKSIEVADRIAIVHADNQKFTQTLFGKLVVGLGTGAAAIGAIALLLSKNKSNDDQSSDDDDDIIDVTVDYKDDNTT